MTFVKSGDLINLSKKCEFLLRYNRRFIAFKKKVQHFKTNNFSYTFSSSHTTKNMFAYFIFQRRL